MLPGSHSCVYFWILANAVFYIFDNTVNLFKTCCGRDLLKTIFCRQDWEEIMIFYGQNWRRKWRTFSYFFLVGKLLLYRWVLGAIRKGNFFFKVVIFLSSSSPTSQFRGFLSHFQSFTAVYRISSSSSWQNLKPGRKEDPKRTFLRGIKIPFWRIIECFSRALSVHIDSRKIV